MKNSSKLFVLLASSVMLSGCVEDDVYTTGSSYPASRTYSTHSAPPPTQSGSYVTGTYSSSAAEPAPMPPRGAVYQTGSIAEHIEGGSSGSGGYMTDAQ